MSSETEIFFPDILPFPFIVHALLPRVTDPVKHGQKILNYAFVHHPAGASGPPETRFGSWDATFEGELKAWNVKLGETITRERARSKPALRILEPCKHGIQFNGLCALCGINMDHFDYTGRAESSRATIQMTHSASGPTVSLEEAQRLERETAEHLLKSRKLSLIVDLDQTIVHATVDPTVGDWITEGEAWEGRHARREAKRKQAAEGEKEDGSEDSEDSEEDDSDEDEVNPNWEALKDVKKFRLPPDNFCAPKSRWKDKHVDKGIQNEGCLYYVKPRPGWKEFLSSVASRYEMHVYTMGTRAYAEKVCAAIDPDGRLFGGRILSRDESGSLTQKSLRRLFPCDTSMVVIIDDRADVWEWSPNLIKVIPYDFFIGIGDINSTFLPKLDAMGTGNVSQDGPETPTESSDAPAQLTPPIPVPSSPTPPSTTGSEPVSEDTADELPGDQQSAKKTEMITQNTLALEAQVEERPLAKKQEQLESDDDTEKPDDAKESEHRSSNGETVVQTEHPKSKHHRKALLKNDDTELMRVRQLLDEVHTRFFGAYDNRLPENNTSKRRRSVARLEVPYDVKFIIPNIRKETFKDVHILFSGVIPTNIRMDHEATEIWRMARAFGATCHRDLDKEVTHVVTSKRGTQKVEKARSQPNIFVVWLQWFTDSVAQWRRQDERRYLLDATQDDSTQQDVASSSPPSDPNAISTDTDPEGLVGDGDEEDLLEDLLDEAVEAVPNSESLVAPTGESAGVTDLDTEGPLNLNEVDWQNANDEVDAAMMESDSEMGDDDDDDVRSTGSIRSSNVSEDESAADEEVGGTSLTVTTRQERKRLRSITPSERGQISEELRSPLAKRKKIAASRSGMSKLKTAVSVNELATKGSDDGSVEVDSSNPGTPVQENGSNGSFDDGDEETEDGEEIDDDFLAREMEAELG
ncbi:uncharacterized protein FOMMEDRAFT_105888 [Fomitiporia mediterranea MF3/22]|uniref:uncharacterized protein n=1 Tax=Fomitiporia mediterranea (strain MF3/22) TaxID=694068 RepID=UPI0004409120|nr:uncharacterized protein FOMMEDRAFT_105888 [Fomitiporia mediterranea MF3/22]EJD03740.1 hypothetical protein FOMMEDRAFT_105888 [Fomitiporia mediterranea MF3/22]